MLSEIMNFFIGNCSRINVMICTVWFYYAASAEMARICNDKISENNLFLS